jgi:uncharacterized SAM-binding protein YcdF (DUF218 family)
MQVPAPSPNEAGTREPPRRGRVARYARGLWRVMAGMFTAIGVGTVLAVGAGFLWFAQSVPTEEVRLQHDADGIVVLTGGSSRISDAIELLASKRGQRLLISGVHPTTRQQELAQLMPEYRKIFDCCVDLDRSALNTVGNAIETRRWAKGQGFKSLIVVTSNYHIPRAMAELAHQLPDVSLIAFPVVTHRMSDMWQSETTAKLLFFEYLKYMVAQARMRFDPVT